jgi:amidohydrolase
MTTLVDLSQDVNELTPGMIALRRELHQHPELAFEEVWTAATLAGRMQALGLAVQEGIGGTGVLAVLEGGKPGKTLLIRSDIDALPMEDATGKAYASKLENRNHACGHDAHAAVVAGVAEVLLRHRDRIAGRIAFVFQPADEPMRGAQRMIEDGLLERVKPDMSLSVHVLPMAHAGQAVIQTGPIWASRDELTLHVSGPTPVGGTPGTFDFARTAAQITTALYDLVEQEGKSTEHVTFRVRSLQAEQDGPGWLGGSRGEPDRAAIEVNLALYDNALRARLLGRIAEVSRAIISAAGGTLRIAVDYALPALVNDDYVTGALEQAAQRVIGQANIIKNWRNPFSDDFGLFMAAAPGCLMLLGTANPGKGITEIWHRPGFDIDEDALPVGVQIMSLAALDLLQER